MQEFREVDPADLHVASSRWSGADPAKLYRQIAKYGASLDGMPHLTAYIGSDGELEIYDGVTRATRAVRMAPGQKVPVLIIGRFPVPRGHLPKIGDLA